MIVALVLAAGCGRRFLERGNKLLESFRGRPLLRHAVDAALASRVAETIVVTGFEAERVEPVLEGLPLCIRRNREYEEGMASSLRTGLRHAEGADGVVVLLGDMPLIRPELIDRLIADFEAGGASAVAPTHGGRRGNPVLLGRGLFPSVARLSGDAGARALLRARDDVREFETDDPGVIIDVDTASDLFALDPH
ncbi:MAG: nucleotidyltransferase family protein [Methylocystis sp.]